MPNSYERYGKGEWAKAARMLARMGLSTEEVEAVLRSKWMRWAADATNSGYGYVKAAALKKFMADPLNKCTPEAIEQLTKRSR